MSEKASDTPGKAPDVEEGRFGADETLSDMEEVTPDAETPFPTP